MGFNEIELEDDVKIELDGLKKFKLVMFNDDFTSMEFVMMVLTTVLKKSEEESKRLMLNIHQSGKGGKAIVHETTLAIAHIKKKQIDKLSDEYNFPLKVTVEE